MKRENLIIYLYTLHLIQDVPRNLFYQLKDYLKAKNFNDANRLIIFKICVFRLVTVLIYLFNILNNIKFY